MASKKKKVRKTIPSPEVEERKRRKQYTAKYKLKILQELDECSSSSERGAILRREGLYSSLICKWRQQHEEGRLSGLQPKKRGRKETPKDDLKEEIKRLKQENGKLQKKLKQAKIIIETQKKISELLSLSLTET